MKTLAKMPFLLLVIYLVGVLSAMSSGVVFGVLFLNEPLLALLEFKSDWPVGEEVALLLYAAILVGAGKTNRPYRSLEIRLINQRSWRLFAWNAVHVMCWLPPTYLHYEPHPPWLNALYLPCVISLAIMIVVGRRLLNSYFDEAAALSATA